MHEMKKWIFICSLQLASSGWAANLSHLQETPVTRSMLFHIVKWPKDCEQDYLSNKKEMSADVVKRGGLTLYPINKTQSLVQVLCFTAAYQANYYFVYVDSQKETAQLVSFKVFDFDSNHQLTSSQETNVAGLPTFKDGLLTLFNKARGPGDCGSLVSYGFTKQGKTYIAGARAKECDNHSQGLDHWPWVERK